VIFSLEMPREQLAVRMICSEARVDISKVRQGALQPEDWSRLTEAASFMSSLPIWIEDQADASVFDIRAKVRRYQAQYNLDSDDPTKERKIGLVVVDYLQLMKGREGAQSREQEISEISRSLKVMAKELGVPVIALSQLNRAVETRSAKDKRPQLSDLRESGAIEQDADVIVFIYRDEYYHPDDERVRGLAEWIIAKQRNGESPCKAMMKFQASCTRFDTLAPGDYPEEPDTR
jgi:replicative DNA helicase